jgi:hypothetical protein
VAQAALPGRRWAEQGKTCSGRTGDADSAGGAGGASYNSKRCNVILASYGLAAAAGSLFRLLDGLQGGQTRMARPTTPQPKREQKQMRAEARKTFNQQTPNNSIRRKTDQKRERPNQILNIKRRDPSQNRSGKEKTQPTINKHQTTGSVAKRSGKAKGQLNINKHQTTESVAKQIRKRTNQILTNLHIKRLNHLCRTSRSQCRQMQLPLCWCHDDGIRWSAIA